MEKNQEKGNLNIQKSNYSIQKQPKYAAGDSEEIIVDFMSKFYDPFSYRKTGRSTVVAKAFIKIAKRYPGQWINILDHFPRRDTIKFTMKLIYNELRKTNEISYFRFNNNNLSVMYTPYVLENDED
ncbi:MAG: hypothetical protein ACOCVF_04235 [bacterium]